MEEKLASKIADLLRGLDEKELEAMKNLVVEIIKRDDPVYGGQGRKQ